MLIEERYTWPVRAVLLGGGGGSHLLPDIRAYQSELVETDEVIQAQLMEAMMAAQHYKARYEHVALLSRLDLTVGTEVLKQIVIR